MAQALTDDKPKSSPTRQGAEDRMIDFNVWLKAEAEEATAEEATEQLSTGKSTRLQATTVVTGRPTIYNPVDCTHQLSTAKRFTPVEIDLCGKNWIGQLIEYRHANPQNTGPVYEESSPAYSLFTCLVRIGERPSSPMGDPNAIFNKKKDAKNYAAKLAIEWLIENKHMPSDGSVSFPKPRPLPAAPPLKAVSAVSPSGSASHSTSPTPHHRSPVSLSESVDTDLNTSSTTTNPPLPASPAQQVAALCDKLVISLPTYVLTRHADLPAIYSGHALFAARSAGRLGTGLDGPVGEVRNVFGKKRAREACAEKLVGILEALVEGTVKNTGLGSGSGTAVITETESALGKEEVVEQPGERSLLD